jgi:membrane-associated phospholipid phosphatase
MRAPLRRLALIAAAIGAATPPLRRRLNIPRPAVSVLAWQAPVAFAWALPRTRVRDAAIYALQMWAYVAHYEMPNDKPEQLLARVHVGYPVKVDRIIGLGTPPTIRLQRALGGGEGVVKAHDKFLSGIHWAWFFIPHGSIAYVLVFHRPRFERSAAQMAGVFDLGLLGYWLLPTAPPWWAGSGGEMPHVRRIMVETGKKVWGRHWEPLYDSLGTNPFAAMPSLHFATSVMAAHVLGDTGRTAGALGWAYAATLGFALVYLGEHYVADLLAGLALAEGVRRAAPRAAPAVRAAQRAIQRLEPRRT